MRVFGSCDPAFPAPPPFGGTAPPPASFNATAGVLGVHAGYNWRLSAFAVAGVEVDYDRSRLWGNGVSNFLGGDIVPFAGPAVVATQDVKGFGTIRARLGWLPRESWLIYTTGGFAYARVDETVGLTDGNVTAAAGATGYSCTESTLCFAGASSRTATGFAVGLGSELALSDHVSVRAEYLYVGLNGRSVNVVAVDRGAASLPASFTTSFNNLNFNVARVGISYKFGGPGSFGR